MSDAKRVVVVGSKGQVAMALARALPLAGLDLTILGRPDFDLTRPAELADAIRSARPDVVINPAAFTAVDRAEDEPELAFALNRDGAAAVASAAARCGAAIVHYSTDYVFNGRSKSPYTELDDTDPQSVYGASKRAGEIAVAAANPRHVILRTAWVCSPDGANFVLTMLRLAATRPELRVVNDQFGCPTFATDIAVATAAITHTLANLGTSADHCGLFHMASSGPTTWYDFAVAIMAGAQRRGAPVVPVHAIDSASYPTKVARPANSTLATDKLEQIYGCTLPHWQSSLDTCLDQILGASKA
jgi:dTDP-4-dehydrorhamnose reductase